VDWFAPLSVIVGAALGVGSTLAIERIRWRRDRDQQWDRTRRDVYVDFLTALSRAHSSMRTVALDPGVSTADRLRALRFALDDSGVWRSRQSLALTAPHSIIRLAMAASTALEAVLDVLAVAPDDNDDRYLQARQRLWLANAELRSEMRNDLGVEGPGDPELDHLRTPP
jgi:hypothetical protein